MLNLRQVYDILTYAYGTKDRAPASSVCLVLVPPANIAMQFPSQGKEGEDSSPAHVTVAYLGTMPLASQEITAQILDMVCITQSPFVVSVGAIDVFHNDKQDVYVSQIISPELHSFRARLQTALAMANIEIDAKHPEYKPHMTIEYVPKGGNRRFEHMQPSGQWLADSAWLWGFNEPYLLQFQ